MSRKLVVVIKSLTEPQRKQIADAAADFGFRTVFFDTEEEALPAVEDAEILFSWYPSLAAKAGNLRWLCSPYAGVDGLTEPGAFASPDALLTNSSGAYGVTISEHVVMVTLEILRRRAEYAAHTARKEWVRKLPIRSIHGSRVTLWGTGDIGQEVARRFRSFRPASIIGINAHGENPEGLFDAICLQDELDAVLSKTDLLIMSLPGTDKTYHALNTERLMKLPDGAVVVNVGRGSCADEKALERELESGRLHASLDVFENEPLPEDSSLWDCKNLLITHHVAGDLTLPYTLETVVKMFLENLELYANGKPLLRQVDKSVGY